MVPIHQHPIFTVKPSLFASTNTIIPFNSKVVPPKILMATANFSLPLLPLCTLRHHTLSSSTPSFYSKSRARTRNGYGLRIQAMDSNFLGDYGARDPFPAELESGFAEKVLGNVDTEHKILIPNISALSLSQQECTPISPLQSPLSEDDTQKLLKKVVGWRLLNEDGVNKLQCLWKLRDFKCGVELINRIYRVAEAAGHFPNLHIEQPNQVRAELWTASIGGLSLNDFIVAAKMDEIKTSDLVPKKRVWA